MSRNLVFKAALAALSCRSFLSWACRKDSEGGKKYDNLCNRWSTIAEKSFALSDHYFI